MFNHPAIAKFKQEFFPILFVVTLQWWVYSQIQFGGPTFTLISNISGVIFTIFGFSIAYLAYPYVTMEVPYKDTILKITWTFYGVVFHLVMFYVWYIDYHRVSDVVYLGLYAYFMLLTILFHNAMYRIPSES